MLITLTGDSGSGKSATEKILCEEYGYKKIVSYTTRQPREGEVEGVDYHFITKEKFKSLVEDCFFAEYAVFSGNCYGTAKEDYEGDQVLVCEIQGLLQLKCNPDLNILAFFLSSPELTRCVRMDARGDDLKSIFKRLRNDREAFKEVKEKTDYIIYNDAYTDIYSIAEIIDRTHSKYKKLSKKKARGK